MEATKKKKAYIKPRMEKFEMKMETAFLAGSKEIIVIPEEDYIASAGVSPCYSQGTTCGTAPSVGCEFVVNDNFMTNGCAQQTITLNGVNMKGKEVLIKAGLLAGHRYKVISISSDGNMKCEDITSGN